MSLATRIISGGEHTLIGFLTWEMDSPLGKATRKTLPSTSITPNLALNSAYVFEPAGRMHQTLGCIYVVNTPAFERI